MKSAQSSYQVLKRLTCPNNLPYANVASNGRTDQRRSGMGQSVTLSRSDEGPLRPKEPTKALRQTQVLAALLFSACDACDAVTSAFAMT